MALPVTITGISTAIPTVGPFRSSTGSYYFFGVDSATATTLQAYKSTAPDTSWASIATKTGFTTGIAGLTGDQDGDTIHLIVTDGTVATALNHKYQTFNMASDAFVTAETIASALATAGQTGGGQPVASLTVRSTGEVVAFFNGAQTQTTGTNRARVYYSRRTGVATWTAPIEVDASAAADAKFPVVVLGAADSVHFVWSETNLLQRTLNASNVLQTQTQYASGATTPLEGVSYSAGGQTRVLVGAGGNFVFYFNSADAPTVNASNPTSTDNRLLVDAGDTSKVWLLYRNSTDSDIYVKSSSDYGATWGTPVASLVGTTVAGSLSLNGNVYQRGTGTYVVPYLVNDNGTLKYNEATVRSLAKTLYFKNVAATGSTASGSLQDGGTAPAAAITTTGWTVAKLAAGNFSLMQFGTEKASGTFSTTDALATPSLPTNPPGAWRSEQPFTGQFAATAWSLVFRMRAVSAASSQAGRVKCRIWKSTNADGTGATELTSGALTGSTTAALSTTASQSSTVTWTPAAPVALINEYIWVQCEWNITTASGSNSGDAVFYIESTAAIATSDFVPLTTDAWSATDKSANITLSNADKTATLSSATSAGIRSVQKQTNGVAGKWYAEFIVNALPVTVGTQDATAGLTFAAGNSIQTQNGNIYQALSVIGGITNLPQVGDRICIAWDTSQKFFYARLNNEAWNADPAIEPGRNNGLAGNTADGSFGLWMNSSTSGASVTMCPEVADIAYGVPHGYKTWMNETAPAVYAQKHFRFRTEDASNVDATPTWLAAEDVAVSVPTSGKFRIRFAIENTGTGTGTTGTNTWTLKYSKNGGAYGNIDAGTDLWASAAGEPDNTPVTVQRLTSGAGAWYNGQYDNADTECYDYDLTGKRYTELEFALELGNAVATDTLDFRLYINGSPLTTYSATPRVTVSSAPNTWNKSDKSANITLSNLDKTATAGDNTSGGVRSTTTRVNGTAGKYYAEFLINAVGAQQYLGLLRTNASLNASTGMLLQPINGSIITNGTVRATIATATNNDVVCIAWDSGAGLFWARKANGIWNNNAAANPATGTGGFTAAVAGTYALVMLSANTGTSATVRTEVADLTYYGPAGFTSWMGEALPQPVDCTATAIAVGAPVFDVPTLALNIPSDALTAPDFAVGSPAGEAATLGQIYNFQPSALVVASPELGTPVCGFPPIAMTATDLAATAPELGTPALKVVSLLSAANLATAPPLPDTATLGQVHALTVIALAPASPALSAATLTQQHSFTAIAPAPGSPVSAAALFGQVHSLTASALAVSASSISITTAGQSHVLLASTFANSSLTISASAITQTHALTAAAFATSAPTLQASNVSIIVPVAAPYLTIKAAYQETIPVFSIATPDVLHAENLVVGVPIFSGPALGQTHVIVAAPLTTTAAPTIAVLGQKHVLAAPTSAIAGVPAFTAPALGQNHVFTAITAAGGGPVYGAAVLGQTGVLAAMPLELSAPSLGVGILGQKHVLSATPLADSAPALGQPALGKVLSAANLATSIPVFGAPLLSHTLIAVDFADSVPTFTAPALGKVLSATSLAVGSPAIATLILVQQHVLTAISVADSSPVFGPAFLGQAGVLGAIPVAAGSPVLSVAVFGQKHVLTAIPLAVASPTIGQTALSKTLIAIDLALSAPILGMPRLSHALVAVDLAGTSGTFGTPAIGYAFPAAALVTSAPIIGVGIFGQKHVLTAANLAVGLPVFGPAVLSGAGVLAAIPLYVSSPVLGTPAFGQKHVLAAVSLADSALSIGVSAIGQTHALVAVAIAAATPSIGVPLFKQIHALTAVNIAAAVPTIGSSIFGQTHVLTALPIATAAPVLPALTAVIYSGFAGMPAAAGAPVIDAPAFGQKHVLTAQDLAVSAPTIDASALAKKLTAVGITVSTPVISSSTLTKALTAAPLSVGASSLTAPALIAVAGLGATGLSVSVPAIGSPAFGQDHKFTAAPLAVGKPVLPALSIKQASDVEPLPPDLDVPVLGTPLLKQRHVFTAVAAAAGAPELEQLSLDLTSRLVAQSFALSYPTQFAAPVFKQNHVLGAVDLVAGRPIPGTAFLGQAGVMAAVPLWVASPVLGTAAFSQRHRFTANPAVAGRPTLGIPGLVPIAVMPRPWHVYLGRFQYTAPILGQEHRLTALAASAGSPQGLLARFIEEETFEAVSLAVSATNIGTPVLTVAARFTAIGLAPQSPAQSRPALGQVHQLTARSLVVSRITFTRPNMDVVEFLPDPVDLVVGRPVIGVPDYIPALRDHAVVDIISRRRRPTIIGQRPIGSPKVDVTGRRQSTAIIGQRPIGSPKVDVTGRRGKRPMIIGRRY